MITGWWGEVLQGLGIVVVTLIGVVALLVLTAALGAFGDRRGARRKSQ